MDAVSNRMDQRVGGGGFLPTGSATLGDGTLVKDVFTELETLLTEYGYHKAWQDGWLREEDGAIVTAGYSYREVRVRRYLPGHKEREPEAVISILREAQLDKIEEFVRPVVQDWAEQRWVA